MDPSSWQVVLLSFSLSSEPDLSEIWNLGNGMEEFMERRSLISQQISLTEGNLEIILFYGISRKIILKLYFHVDVMNGMYT